MSSEVKYPRYELIYVEYEDGEYLGHLIKICHDDPTDPDCEEYVDGKISFSVEDAIETLGEKIRFSRSVMGYDEFYTYLETLR